MYLFTSTLKPAVGKSSDAVAWAKELSKVAADGEPGGGFTGIYRELFGEEGTIVVTREFSTLADLEAFIAWAARDARYQATLKRGQEAGIQAGRFSWKVYQVM